MIKFVVGVFIGIFLVLPGWADVASVDFVTTRDNATVHKSGDETINGTKTFTQIPMIPTANLPTLQS